MTSTPDPPTLHFFLGMQVFGVLLIAVSKAARLFYRYRRSRTVTFEEWFAKREKQQWK